MLECETDKEFIIMVNKSNLPFTYKFTMMIQYALFLNISCISENSFYSFCNKITEQTLRTIHGN